MGDVVDKTTEIVEEPEKAEATEARSKVDEILGEHGIDPEELQDLLDNHKRLKTTIGNRDAEDLIAAAKKWEDYQEWQTQEKERKLRDEEDPEDTVKRLDKELKALRAEKARESQEQEEQRKISKALKTFEKTAIAAIGESDVPDTMKGVLKMLCGVGNPANEVELTNAAAVKKMVKSHADMLKDVAGQKVSSVKDLSDDIKQAVIKDYLAGKIKVPKVPAESGGTPPEKETKAKDMRARRRLFHQLVTDHFKAKS